MQIHFLYKDHVEWFISIYLTLKTKILIHTGPFRTMLHRRYSLTIERFVVSLLCFEAVIRL